MELNDYIRSDQYAAVIETDHGVMINGMIIPHVLNRGVLCNDSKTSIHQVTLTFMTDSFIRLSGKPSEKFEKEHGYGSDSKDSYRVVPTTLA